LNGCVRILFATACIALSGCAHGQLRNALRLGPFESTSEQNIQAKANKAFPVGTPYEQVRQRLGRNSGEIAPIVMFLTLRPWPFEPWRVSEQSVRLVAVSEDERSWFAWFRRSEITINFEFDSSQKLTDITVKRTGSAL
jgi:hypothetical protein